ncbi:MAG TPA: sigma-70 family RNA polymerase sigma factor [Puia sp.]|uniref:RNA polymerase sigma factor n=1 Tax=Puia sp. TaxID=2045100 RepID=UPI002BADDB0A|nr:sigma-70 family RNA polymerase sigma factor [Puia sp.]HVU95466.1 sigma-70 family RNA polymerase sigma factor [Puia sp.]
MPLRYNLSRQLERFRNGDQDAFRFFVDHYRLRIFYFLLQKVCIRQLAQDLMERTFLLLFANRSSIPTVKHLRGFLYYTASECGDLHLMGRSCIEEGNFEMPDSRELLAVLDEFDVILNEADVEFYKYVEKLSPEPKIVVEMRFFIYMDISTITAERGIDHKTVEKYISKAHRWRRNHPGGGWSYLISG